MAKGPSKCIGAREASDVARPEPVAGKTEAPAEHWRAHPLGHLALLYGLVAWCVGRSWRRWPDLIVDFGRELYTPWRLSEGAVLFRDVDGFYGPLSQYLNAGLFSVFGPGFMIVVWANLCIYMVTLTTLYFLVRRAWGATAALAALAVFIAVFSFARYSSTGNYNYAAPYSHETTHGMLVLVVLIAVLIRWLRSPSARLSGAVGFLFGLTFVLKPEFILSGGVVIGASVVLFHTAGRSWRVGWIISGMVGAVLPTLAFAAYFSRHLPGFEGWTAAGRGWLNVVGTSDYIRDPAQLRYAGLDLPWIRFQEHAVATAVALGIFGLIAIAGHGFERIQARTLRIGFATVMVGGIAVASHLGPSRIWADAGRCLLGLNILYLVCLGFRDARRRIALNAFDPAFALRVLLPLFAAAMMFRMILNGRVHQFGYYQASGAAIVVVAWLCGEFPKLMTRTRAGHMMVQLCVLGFLMPGIVRHWKVSSEAYRRLNFPVGKGADRFFAFAGSDAFVSLTSYLAAQPPGGTLLVLPEGLMANYLVRMRSPIAPFFFYSAVTENAREAQWVEALAANPPDWVATVSRDLSEYGITVYGERSGAGRDLLAWVEANYLEVGSGQPAVFKPAHVQLFERRAKRTLAPNTER